MTGVRGSDSTGGSLIEVAVAMAIVAILSGVALVSVPSLVDSVREDSARAQLIRIRKAIVGERRQTEAGNGRLDFGYIGDMGRLPSTLDELTRAGDQPDYRVDAGTALGHGWRGPYLARGPSDFLVDPWGNAVALDLTEHSSTYTGGTVVATLTSAGPDGTSATPDDILVEVHESEVRARIVGYVRNKGSAASGVDVTLRYPDDGSSASATAVTDAAGFYEFAGIAFGDRVLEYAPHIDYVEDTGVVTAGNGNDIEFSIENIGHEALNVTAFSLTYTASEPAWYEEIHINGVELWDENNDKIASGEDFPVTLTFGGTSARREPVGIQVSAQVFQVPDIALTTLGAGDTLDFEIIDFETNESGNGGAVDMTGVQMQVDITTDEPAVYTTYLTVEARRP